MEVNHLPRLYKRALNLISQYYHDEISEEDFKDGMKRLETRIIKEKANQ